MTDLDAYRSAKTLIETQGDWAEDHARDRIYDLMEADDQAGVAAWRGTKPGSITPRVCLRLPIRIAGAHVEIAHGVADWQGGGR